MLRQRVLELKNEIEGVRAYRDQVVANHALDVERLRNQVGFEFQRAEALERRCVQLEDDRDHFSKLWENSRSGLDSKYERLFGSKPPQIPALIAVGDSPGTVPAGTLEVATGGA